MFVLHLSPTSDGMWQIAQYLGHSGSYQAARELYQSIADAHEQAPPYGPERRDTLAVRHLLARWTDAGDATAARDQLASLLSDMQRILGPRHHDTLITRSQLAYYTGEAGDPAAARDQLEKVLPEMERVLGKSHPHSLVTRHELAYYTGLAGDPAWPMPVIVWQRYCPPTSGSSAPPTRHPCRPPRPAGR